MNAAKLKYNTGMKNPNTDAQGELARPSYDDHPLWSIESDRPGGIISLRVLGSCYIRKSSSQDIEDQCEANWWECQ